MPATSAAMELRVLINVLQSGSALKTLLEQTNQLSKALTQLQAKANAAGGASAGAVGATTAVNAANAVTTSANAAAKATQTASQGIQAMGVIGNTAAGGVLAFEKAVTQAVNAVKFLTGGFLALQSVRFLKGLADEAARVQVLGTVLHVVAVNSGYTAEQIDEVDKKVQRLGITAASSRQSLTQFLQARLDVKFAPALARAAQDLAVIAGVNSSDTFKRLIVNIQQLDTMGLRFMGIVTDRRLAEQRYRDLHKEITGVLSRRQMQEALLIEVLEKAKLLEGTYSNAMGDVGKQLTSLSRFTETYREILGESLLPAYSAIVVVITKTLEKLIVLAKEFSANEERAQAMADAATQFMEALSSLIVVVAEHLDQIVTLMQYYVAFKAIMLAFSAIAGTLTWVASLIGWFARLRVVMAALQANTTTLTVAIQAMGTKSVQAAREMMELARTQGQVATTSGPAAVGVAGVGTAAAGTTVAVGELTLAWKAFLASLVIPAAVYAFFKALEFANKEVNKPLMQKALEARGTGPSLVGFQTQMQSPLGKLFEQWKTENAGLVVSLKTGNAAWAEFNRQIDAFRDRRSLSEIAQSLSDAKIEAKAAAQAVGELDAAAAEPGAPRAYAERAAAADRLATANQRVANLQDFMNKTFEAQPAFKDARQLLDQIDKVSALEKKLGDTRRDYKKNLKNQRDITDAEAELEEAKSKRDALLIAHEDSLRKKYPTNEQAVKDEMATIRIRAGLTAISDETQKITEATQAMFGGGKVFTDEGVLSGAFNKVFGGFDDALDQAEAQMQRTGKILPTLAKTIEEGITVVGKAVSLPLDQRKFQESLARIDKLALPEAQNLKGRIADALKSASLGVQQAAVAETAEIVGDRRRRATETADIAIDAAQHELHSITNLEEIKRLQLEDSYKQQKIGLERYFDDREDLVNANANAELRLQDEKIAKAKALEAVALTGRDLGAIAAARAGVRSEEEERRQISARREAELEKLRLDRNEQRRALRDVQNQLLAQIAQYGGVEEALAHINSLIDRQRYFQLLANNPIAAQLAMLKDAEARADAFRKARENAYQAELAIGSELEAQLDLLQQQRDIAAARDRAAVGRGEMTEREASTRNIARIESALIENRSRRFLEQRKLEQATAFREQEAQKREQEIFQQNPSISDAELRRKVTEEWNKHTQAVNESKAAINSLDLAYVELSASMESASLQAAKAVEEGFANALSQTLIDFHKAGEAWISFGKSIGKQIADAISTAFTQALFKKLGLIAALNRLFERLMGLGGPKKLPLSPSGGPLGTEIPLAEGGPVTGPGTGTSDSIPAMLSAGEHVMPASKAAQWMPVLEAIRLGRMSAYALGGAVALQSIAIPSVIPRRYAGGGMVISDAGASAVSPAGGVGNMVVSLHPDALNMTMREWLEHEVVRQQGRR